LAKVPEINRTITEKDLQDFAKLTDDDNKLHMDKEYASKTIYKNLVIHGMLGASFILTLSGAKLPGGWGPLWFS
jgi:3-oxoacyl-[acyl-carrier protein] reductase